MNYLNEIQNYLTSSLIMANSESEEEMYVYAEFDQNVNIEKYRSIHAIGIESTRPIIQMDDTFFTGKFVEPMGTFMFFENDSAMESLDPLFDKIPSKPLKFMVKTRKFLKMEHAYVTSKEGKDEEIESHFQKPDDDIELVNFNNIQEAIEKFKNSWSPDCELQRDNIVNKELINIEVEDTNILNNLDRDRGGGVLNDEELASNPQKPEEDTKLVVFNDIQASIEKFKSSLKPDSEQRHNIVNKEPVNSEVERYQKDSALESGTLNVAMEED